jgi:large subunit ribosomal protein L9
LVVVLLRQAGEGGQLFGSVSAKDVADALVAKSYAVTRQQVLVSKPVKALGIAPFVVQLHPEVRITINVNVAMSGEEAASQEKAWKEAAAA